MAKKKTQEGFEKEIFDLVGNEYKVLGKYIKNDIKIKMKHVECGHGYEVRPGNFLRGVRCPRCSNRKTHEEFVKEVSDIVSNEYEILGKYIKNDIKIKMKHVECSHEYEVRPSDFLSKNSRCPKCSGLMKKTTKIFKEEVFDLVENEYEVLGQYTNALKKIKIKHDQCGFEYEVQPNSFLSGSRCPKCAGFMKKTTNEFKEEVFNLVGEEYKILGEYINALEKIKIKHVGCSHEYEVKPNKFLQGTRCPQCCNSKGFSKGEKELVEFIRSFYSGTVIENDRTIIPSMVSDKFYELDVFLPDLDIAIEYNGSYWHDLRELELPGYHDYKSDECRKVGIELINISDSDWTNQTKQKEIKKEIMSALKQKEG